MSGWENVGQYNGVSITVVGISIVFAALALITGFITLLPRVMDLLHLVVPEDEQHRTPIGESQGSASSSSASPSNGASAGGAIAAAIGYAMHLDSKK